MPASSSGAEDPVAGLVDPPISDVAPLPVPPELSTPAEEVVQLAQARVPNDVLLAYIEGVASPFALGAAEILYLTDLGVPAETIAAMVRRDQELKAQPVAAVAATPPTMAAATAAVAEAEGMGDSVPAGEVAANGLAPAFEVMPAATTAPAEPVQPVQQVTHNYFYNSLSPYGSWRESPDHGWVWQPSVAVVEPGWQPYFHGGRWMWTDCGWYWHSYYSWGWAPFHYGRWHRSPSWGWVWSPGNVWGPAWVTWRYYDGFCGWAPLPPACGYVRGAGFTYHGARVGFGFGFGLTSACYAFVPVSHFHVARPWVHSVGHGQVNQFYGNTTVINNYVHGNNNTIINRGIGTEVVASRTELRKVRITDTAGLQPGTAIRGERLSRDGSTLAVHRPRLPEPAARPPAVITQRQERVKVRTDSLLQSRPVQAARLSAAASADNPLPARAVSPVRSQAAPARAEPVRAPGREGLFGGEGRGELAGSGIPASPRTEPQATRPDRPVVGSAGVSRGASVRPNQAAATGPTATSPASARPAPVANPPNTTVPTRPSAATPRSTPSFSVQPRAEPSRPTPAPLYRSAPALTPGTRTFTPAPAPAPVYRSAPPSRPTFTPSPTVRQSPSPAPRPEPAQTLSAPSRSVAPAPTPAPARPSASPSASGGSRPGARPPTR